MNKALYIATSESYSGKSIVALGLMHALTGRIGKVAYFRPIIADLDPGIQDNHIETVLKHFNLPQTYEQSYGFKKNELVRLLNEGSTNSIIDRIIEKFKYLESRYNFVLVEGSDFSDEVSFIEMDLNVLIAKNLGIPVVIVGSGKGKTLENYSSQIHLTYDTFKEREVEVIGVIANKVHETNLQEVKFAMQKELPDVIVSVIPRVDSLAKPTVKEIVHALEAEVLFGGAMLNNKTGKFSVGAMQLRNFLNHLSEDTLVITPGDRADVILGTLQAHESANYPNISGIVLTGGLAPDQNVLRLIDGLGAVLPILLVREGTFAVTNKIGSIQSKIYSDNKDKILKSIQVFEEHMDLEGFMEKFTQFNAEGITPSMFQYNLMKRTRSTKKHIVLPEGTDSRVLHAAARLSNLDLVNLTLLGDATQIQTKLSNLGLTLDSSKVNLINPVDSPNYEDYVKTFYELRKHKNVNIHMAEDLLTDVSYFGTMMVYKGDADGMVSGAVHTTQHTIRPALQFVKTKPGVSVVSSVFFMCLEDRVSVFGDCAINPNPNAEQLAEIAISSADSSRAFGIEPKVAMLSYSSGSSGKGEEVDKVRKATEIVKKLRPDLKIEGPIQYDAAVDKEIGKAKLPNSDVAGEASVLIFPDLNTGNNTYKAIQRETGALAIGPMLQGLNAPINDLSRGCTTEDIFNTVMITAIQAQGL
jgi:phosphate acetyltransferase